MKFIHISDLHIGRRLGEYSLLDDQRFMLGEVLDLIREEVPDALLIAGDIYDKTVPPAEAVGLLDDFLTEAAAMTRVLLIAGNHDSPERIAFGGRLMEGAGVTVCGIYDGLPHKVTLNDAWGEVHFYLLPYLRPADVRRVFPDADTETYDAAFSAAVEALEIDSAARNVLVSHQFVSGSVRSESEIVSVGGTDAVDAGHFDRFDYAALGHLHRAQTCGGDGDAAVHYIGSPLPYSVSEADDEKAALVVTMCEKGIIEVHRHPLMPYRRMYRLRGTYAGLMALDFYRDTDYPDSYVQITLTDEGDIPDALYRLRTVYPYLLRLEYDNTRTRTEFCADALSDAGKMDPCALFASFYKQQNGVEMDAEMQEYMAHLIARIFGEEAAQ